LVAEIEPHLWADPGATPEAAAPQTPAAEVTTPDTPPVDAAPVTLPEPMQPEDDPLASIRDEMSGAPAEPRKGRARAAAPVGPAGPPAPPGPVANGAIQVMGYVIGWGTTIVALPYGLARAIWLFTAGQDLRKIGTDD
jgi:hypothetical protein